MTYLELSVETEAAAVETVSAILHEFGEGGVAIHQDVVPDDEDAAYHYDTSKPTVVTTYVPATDDGEARRQRIAASLDRLTVFNLAAIGPVQVRQVAEEDWAHCWKEFFPPLRFGARIVVKPSWREYARRPEDLVMEIDPGMAFGTGLHQTTAMCLERLETVVQSGMRVLDQGTGSGILSLAAILLGAEQVIAVDTSEVAVLAAQDNAERNGFGGRITARQESRIPREEGPYDLVVVNIIASVIIDLASEIRAALKPGGTLLCSGIIRDREEDVRVSLSKSGLHVAHREARDEWVALIAIG